LTSTGTTPVSKYKFSNYQANLIVNLLFIEKEEGMGSYALTRLLTKPQTIQEKYDQNKEFRNVLMNLNFNEKYHPSKSHVYITIN